MRPGASGSKVSRKACRIGWQTALSPELPPARRTQEQSSGSALTDFFSGLNSSQITETKPKQFTVGAAFDETIDLKQQDESTGESIQPAAPVAGQTQVLARKKAAPRNEKTKLVWFAVGGRVLGIVSAMFMVLVGGGDVRKDPSGADLAAESTNQVPALMQPPFDSSEAQRQQKAWAELLA